MLKRPHTGSRPRGSSEAARLMAFIATYQQAAATAVGVFRSAFGVSDPLRAWHQNELKPSGTFIAAEGTGHYQFHGSGCRFEVSGAAIDVDFGPSSRCDGFDTWRLHLFATENPHLTGWFADRQRLERAFDRLIQSGTIVCPRWEPSPHLYYLAERVNGETSQMKTDAKPAADAAVQGQTGARAKKK